MFRRYSTAGFGDTTFAPFAFRVVDRPVKSFAPAGASDFMLLARQGFSPSGVRRPSFGWSKHCRPLALLRRTSYGLPIFSALWSCSRFAYSRTAG